MQIFGAMDFNNILNLFFLNQLLKLLSLVVFDVANNFAG